MMKNKFIAIFSIVLMVGGNLISAAEPPQNIATVDLNIDKIANIDALMNKAMKAFHIPGAAVGIVINGKVVLTRGYGVRDLVNKLPVTENSIFAIGSCSKAFATFALGQMVDDRLIAWDDPVIKYIPEFSLKDIHATHHLTIRDLVAHRSGLPRHDSVWYNSTIPRAEILTRLPYLEPTNDLREKFQYNNLMYAVAGLVIERVTGQTWEEAVQLRIFNPLEMNNSNFSVNESQKSHNFSLPHTKKNEQTQQAIPFQNLSNMGPAGSINSSVTDMVKWLQIQLSDGKINGKSLIKKETLTEMHSVQMPCPASSFDESPYMFGYGLGWMTGLHKGHYTVAHKGEIDGFISSVVLFPTEKIGIVLLTNSNSPTSFAPCAAYAIADCVIGVQENNLINQVKEQEKTMKASSDKQSKTKSIKTAMTRPLNDYIGEFENPGYGIIKVSSDKTCLTVTYNDITYILQHGSYNHFTALMQSVLNEKVDCSFIDNSSGDISEFQISLEPSLPPIVFKKKAKSSGY